MHRGFGLRVASEHAADEPVQRRVVLRAQGGDDHVRHEACDLFHDRLFVLVDVDDHVARGQRGGRARFTLVPPTLGTGQFGCRVDAKPVRATSCGPSPSAHTSSVIEGTRQAMRAPASARTHMAGADGVDPGGLRIHECRRRTRAAPLPLRPGPGAWRGGISVPVPCRASGFVRHGR